MYFVGGWYGEGSVVLAAAVVLLSVVAVVWLYMPQVKGAGRLWRWVLPVLRVMALGAVGVSFVQPVLRWSWSDRKGGAVVVLVDGSGSMGVVDRRTEAELVSLAAGLGLLPGREKVMGGLSERLEGLLELGRQVVEAGAAVRYAEVSGRGVAEAEAGLRAVVERFEVERVAVVDWEAAKRRSGGWPAKRGNEGANDEARVTNGEMDAERSFVTPVGEIRPFDGGEDWLVEVAERIGRALDAVRQAQAAADERLYREDASVRQVCGELRGLSRLEIVERVLVGEGGLLRRLDPEAPVYGFAFGEEVEPLPLHRGGVPVRRLLLGGWPAKRVNDEAEAAGWGSSPPEGAMGMNSTGGGGGDEPHLTAEPGSLNPSEGPASVAVRRQLSHGSDLTGALAEVLDRMSGERVEAVWIFSDGRQVGREASLPAPLGWSGVGVYTVSAAGVVRRDVAVHSVKVPPRLFAGERSRMAVEVSSVGAAGEEVEVSVRVFEGTAGDGRPAGGGGQGVEANDEARMANDETNPDPSFVPGLVKVRSRRVSLVEEGRTALVEFDLAIAEPGAYRVEIEVEGLSDETSYENNRVERWVRVLEQRVRVGMVSGLSNRDGQFLRRLLAGSGWSELVEAEAGQRHSEGWPAQLLEQDVVVLHGIGGEDLTAEQWTAVHELVRERGGAVVLVAGESGPVSAAGGQVLLLDLLPFSADVTPQWRVWPGEQPVFRLAPAWGQGTVASDEGILGGAKREEKGSEFGVHLKPEPGTVNPVRWSTLPPLFSYLAVPDLKAGVRPLLVERETGAAVVTEMRLGAGRVFFVGLNETWRWRFRQAEDYDRFWSELIRYGSEPPYAVREGDVGLDADRVWMEPEEAVHVRVRVPEAAVGAGRSDVEVRGSADAPDRGAEGLASRPPRVQVLAGEQSLRTLPLSRAGPADGGRYEATLRGFEPGMYHLRLDHASTRGLDRPVELPLWVQRSHEAELREVSGDEALLGRLSERSGGRMLALERALSLAEIHALERAERADVVEYRLWHSPLLFLFVLGCLGTEWALRKRVGLA